ncbi:MAG: DUF2142 domain-containing protein [Gemmatales bacterium]|nr:DUF2142 domain-containing protein [Gemmatales bacterium]MDW8223178.1 DUF2142 domain-containing protein [Gemmatales bacterium]
MTRRLAHWIIAVAIALAGMLTVWGWKNTLRSDSPATQLQTLSWRFREAPLTRPRFVDILGDLLATEERYGSIDLGPVESGILEVRLYAEENSICLPDWKLAWVPWEATAPESQEFLLSLDAFLNTNRVRGELQAWEKGFRVVWRLPQLARQVRLGIPPHSAVRITRLEAIVPQEPQTWRVAALQRRSLRLLGMVVALACCMIAGMVLWPEVITEKRLHGFLLAVTLASFLLTVFWLPPFQGPDEPDHWRDALARYRKDAVTETFLYNLPELAGFTSVRWRAEAHVSSTLFRQVRLETPPLTEPRWVNYAGYHSYPAVALVAWWFPRVETVQEALVFYYLCRLFPVVVVTILLFWAWCRGFLPALALAVFASPYVQQQCVIISTDTLANVSALAAGLCWLALAQRWTWGRYVALWCATSLCFLAKPPIYWLVFALPLWFTPWRRLSARTWWALGLTLVLSAGVLLLVWRGYRAMHQVPVAEQFRQQWQFVWFEGGWVYFLRQPLPAALSIPMHLENWFMPLGWVDTFFQPYHVGFLRGLVYLAVAVDLLRAVLNAPLWCHVRGWLALSGIVVYLTVLFLGTWTMTALVMYLAVTPPRHPFIYGMQVRYLFPCLLLGLWLPITAGLVSRQAPSNAQSSDTVGAAQGDSLRHKNEDNSPPSWTDWGQRILAASWTSAGVVFTAGRMVGLAGDLLARYW